MDCGHPVLVCDDDGFFVVVEVGYDFAVSHEAFTDWSYFHGAFPLVIFGGMGFPAWKIDMRRAPVPLGSGALFLSVLEGTYQMVSVVVVSHSR